MPTLTMRDRILSVIHGRELDRVPFVMYDGLLPTAEVQQELGRENLGLMKWSAIHRIETPHCRFDDHPFYVGDTRWQRRTLYTPAGQLVEERAFEPVYDSSSIRKHFIETATDYQVFWSYLQDCLVLPDYDRYQREQNELGETGLPLVAIDRTPYQQLWVEWVGLDALSYHMADLADEVGHTIELLKHRARKVFDIVAESPIVFVDFPDNITASAIGPQRFAEYCVPLYNELADRLAARSIPVFVHMDGNLKPLWQLIAASRVHGIDSFSPAPDNDTTVADAVRLWSGKSLFVNFPSSVHLRQYDEVRAVAEEILQAGGHTGRLQIQVSENCPHFAWRTSFRAIHDAIMAFGKP